MGQDGLTIIHSTHALTHALTHAHTFFPKVNVVTANRISMERLRKHTDFHTEQIESKETSTSPDRPNEK